MSEYRLVTRSDFDGLVCAVLLRKLNMIGDILFVHPKDVQDGVVEVTDRDILTNLPYAPGAFLVLDHHHSESERLGDVAGVPAQRRANHVLMPDAPSAARVVYQHFGGAAAFPDITEDLMRAVDQADSAQYSKDDILNPQGWTLLNFLMDSRTGLGRFRDFRVSNYQLMMELIEYCATHQNVDDILQIPDVAERVALFQQQRPLFEAQLKRVTTMHGDVAMVDLRGEETIHAGNRFMVYALNPDCRVSVHVIWGRNKQNTVLAVGKSILDRTSPVDIGKVMLHYGGGGHVAAGTCQIDHADSERVLAEVLEAMQTPREQPVTV
ncbi:MAG: exopolyphosphatase [Kineosporiaceae bacterium]